jgi:hypothetical protein
MTIEDGSEVILSGFRNGDNKPFVEPTNLFISLGEPLSHTHKLPDDWDTVIKLTLYIQP